MGGMLESVLNWRLKTPFYYGWLVLGITAVATFAASGVSQVVIGGIQVYITDDTGWSERTISYAATAGTWGSGLLAPFIGRLADRYGPRWLMPSGLLAAGAGLFVLSGADALWQFYGAYILSRAIANPVLIGLVPGTAAVNFFRRRRNVALALVSTFRPISGAINIQIISLIAVHQGWRAAYRYLGILSLLLIIPVALFVRRRPEDIGLLPDGATSETVDQGGGIGRQSVEESWTAGETVRDRTFWLIVATGTVGVLASSSAGFSLVPYLVHEVGLSPQAAAGVLSLGTVLSIANLGWGYLADLYTPRRCLIVTMLGTGAMLGYLSTVGSLPGALVFALIWGVFSGAVGTMENMVLAQYYGRASYGAILGAYAPFQTAALGLGPTLASTMLAVTGDYQVLYFAMMAAHGLAAFLMFLARPPSRIRN